MFAHSELTGAEPDSVETFERLAILAGIAGDGIPWPPGRNEPCWCGSERKYKKCCGAPGFAVSL
ncbi:SEC-C metal-binding domain-containing protein [Amycolatopsis alkalitolerans]|uniref:SEC-C metal-binding domain-containing protein n=1 Tax=Amycolatopsis alkalitolerans TaxID=2547244 RepID=UPI00190F6B00|nr:SEC-C metal-binding domain-containing protein [Amycolatopsis alkalitolerans]